MLFSFYLSELKYRVTYLAISFLLTFFTWLSFSKELLFILVKPLLSISGGEKFYYFIFTGMSDVLLIYFKISCILAVVLIMPIFFLQVWFFLLQGLYNFEKNFLLRSMLFSFFLFYNVIFILYIYIIPFIWNFFINFELNNSNSLFGVYYEGRINDYIDFMFYIFFVFCCLLQFPVVMIFFLYFNLISVTFFINYRKYFIVLFFIIGGLVSPPEVLSQLVISIPILIIYEFILLFSLLFQKYLK